MTRHGEVFNVRWGNWLNVNREACQIGELIGVTHADVKRYRYAWNYDLVELETWNRRRIQVSGIDIVRLTRTLARVLTERSMATTATKGASKAHDSWRQLFLAIARGFKRII